MKNGDWRVGLLMIAKVIESKRRRRELNGDNSLSCFRVYIWGYPMSSSAMYPTIWIGCLHAWSPKWQAITGHLSLCAILCDPTMISQVVQDHYASLNNFYIHPLRWFQDDSREIHVGPFTNDCGWKDVTKSTQQRLLANCIQLESLSIYLTFYYVSLLKSKYIMINFNYYYYFYFRWIKKIYVGVKSDYLFNEFN